MVSPSHAVGVRWLLYQSFNSAANISNMPRPLSHEGIYSLNALEVLVYFRSSTIPIAHNTIPIIREIKRKSILTSQTNIEANMVLTARKTIPCIRVRMSGGVMLCVRRFVDESGINCIIYPPLKNYIRSIEGNVGNVYGNKI